MNRRLSMITGALALGLAMGCQQVPAGTPTGFGISVTNQPAAEQAVPASLTGGATVPAGSYRPNELLIQLSDEADRDQVLAGFERTGQLALGSRIVRVKLPQGMGLSGAYETLRVRKGVGTISLNWKHRKSTSYVAPDDVYVDRQWSHRQTEALDLWKSTDPARVVDASKLIVAVLDTGLDVTHPEFAGRVVLPRDFTATPSEEVPYLTGAPDMDGHGTHVAGIIGATGHNDMGVAGVAWDVKLMPLKVLGEEGGTDFDILRAFSYALGLDADDDGQDDDGYRAELPAGQEDLRTRVISMSLGYAYHGRSPLYDHAFTEARKRGVLVVVAAGNEGGEVAAPANSAYCVAVSSTSPYQLGDRIWEWLSGYSNRGDRIDVSAPGGSIMSTFPLDQGGYATMSGTSMACPYVSGLAALVIARNDPTYQRKDAAFYDAVKAHLAATADDLGAPGKDTKYGYGRVNVRKALTTTFPASL